MVYNRRVDSVPVAISRGDWVALAIFVGSVAAVAVAASWSTVNAGSAYRDLDGPSWAPPSWLFGPAWTVLYASIAVAGWMAWRAGTGLRDPSMIAFAGQLALNGLWSPLFFTLEQRGAALVCILALDVAVAITLFLFWRRRRVAALLLAPYFLWILFATGLNAAFWSLNR